jgi:hypothetical protein
MVTAAAWAWACASAMRGENPTATVSTRSNFAPSLHACVASRWSPGTAGSCGFEGVMGPAVCSGRATDDSRFPLAQLEGHPSRAGETLAMGCTLVRSALHTFGLPTLHRASMNRGGGADEWSRGAWPVACTEAVHASDTNETDAADDSGAAGLRSNECRPSTGGPDAAGRHQAHGRSDGARAQVARLAGEPGEHGISTAHAARRASPPTARPAAGPHRRLAHGAWHRRDHLGRRQQLVGLRPM